MIDISLKANQIEYGSEEVIMINYKKYNEILEDPVSSSFGQFVKGASIAVKLLYIHEHLIHQALS